MATNESLIMELSNMDARLTELEEKIDAMHTKLNQVVDALLGNPLTNSGGFKHEMETINQRIAYLEKKQREFDEFRKRFYWTVGLMIAAGLFFQFVVNIYSKIK
jgi:hypothetical protein